MLTISMRAQNIPYDLPLVMLNTNGQEILDEPRIIAEMGIIDNGEGKNNYITDSFNVFYGRISIEIRGSTSQSFPKKQYALETQDNMGENLNVSLLGMPEENDWILYAPYADKTLIRNALAYHLFGMTGHYSPRTRFCEVFLNGNYQGVYLLIEKIKRDRNRVDISNIGVDDNMGDELSGGYIIKLDKGTGDHCDGWMSLLDGAYRYHYPDCDEITPQQEDYIRGFVYDMEQTFNMEEYTDPDMGYRKYIDIPSYIDYIIINEMAKNVDAYFLSTFFYKDRNSIDDKLKIGPVWDFNIAFGNVDYREGYTHTDLVAYSYTMWTKLLNDTLFFNELTLRWQELREHDFNDDHLLGIIDSLVMKVYYAQQRNFERWNILGRNVWPNYYVGDTYIEETEYLKDWLMQRVYWLDAYFLDVHEEYIESVLLEDEIFPNPFSDILYYRISLKSPSVITVKIVNMLGELESVVIDHELVAGTMSFIWNGLANNGKELENGLYYLILEINGHDISRKKIIKLKQ